MSIPPPDSPAASRETPSFTPLYAEVAPALYTWAVMQADATLGGRLDPEDLTQEVIGRAFQIFHRYDPARGPFRSWIFGIANRVLLETLRQLARRRAPMSIEGLSRAGASLPDDATTISRRVARTEDLWGFLERLRGLGLDEVDRKILIYRGLESLSHDEVASLVSQSADAVRQRWRRLRERMRDTAAPPGLFSD